MFAYTFRAEILCATHAASETCRYAADRNGADLDALGRLSLALWDVQALGTVSHSAETLAESALDSLAEIIGIADRHDTHTYDSDEFPKGVDPYSLTDTDACAVCGVVIDDPHGSTLAEIRLARMPEIADRLESAMSEICDEIESTELDATVFRWTPRDARDIVIDTLSAVIAEIRNPDENAPETRRYWSGLEILPSIAAR